MKKVIAVRTLTILPLLIILIAWLYKAQINTFYLNHQKFFNNIWVNIITFGICTFVLMIVQFKISFLNTMIFLMINVLIDGWLVFKQQKGS